MTRDGVDVVDTHEAVDDVDGNREDDGGVVLGRDTVQCLKIPQLKLIAHSQENLENPFLKLMFLD